MSEIIRSKVFNARLGKMYAEGETPQKPLLWWREIRPTSDGFQVVQVNFDFEKVQSGDALSEAPSNALGTRSVTMDVAYERIENFHAAMEAHEYKPMTPEAVQKAGILELTA